MCVGLPMGSNLVCTLPVYPGVYPVLWVVHWEGTPVGIVQEQGPGKLVIVQHPLQPRFDMIFW